MEAERKEIRKLRKKLRQIEQLERLDRVLNDEEQEKVTKKTEIREKLSDLLKVVEEAGVSLNESGFSNSLNCSPQSVDHNVADGSIEDTAQMDSSFTGHSSNMMGGDNGIGDDSTNKPVLGLQPQNEQTQQTSTSEVEKTRELKDSTHTHASKKKSAQSRNKTSECDELKLGAVSKWLNRKFIVTSLKGHHDVICSVDVNEELLMTGSRDTTVKIWDVRTLEEVRNLGGHKSAVTSVRILPREANDASTTGISGSLDCYIMLWDLDRGVLVRQIYTYSSIQCMECHDNCVYTGLEGGKIDVWNIMDGTQLKTLRNPGKPVTCVFIRDGRLYCGDTSGTIEVWSIASGDLQVGWNASVRRSSEQEDEEDEFQEVSSFSSRCVRCLCCHGNKIYWGDDGTNLKCLEVAANADVVSNKLSNHSKEFGSTGAVTVCEREGVLLSSQYDLDNGQAGINVRNLSSQDYICSISGESVPYISCMVVTTHCNTRASNEQETRLITGGHELRVWDCYPQHRLPRLKKSLNQLVISCVCDDSLNESYQTDTDLESEGEEEGEEEVIVSLHTQPLPHARPSEGVVPQRQQSWLWWLCNIL